MNKLTTLAASTLLGLLPLASAQAAEYNLRFAHFWPATSGIHTAFESWGQALEEASDGRIEVEFYPSQTLTKAPQSYDAVKNRIADVTATVQGYSANRFPLTQVVELPGMAKTAAQGSCVIQSLYDEGKISGEYDDTHVLYVFTHGPGDIHTKEKAIHKPEDLAGLKIRRPTTVVAELLEGLGAQPVGMPAPETYPSLQRGVIDGVAMPWEGIKSFRLNEETQHHTEVGLYTLSFVVTMNKGIYDGMPEELKKIVDEHSGQVWSQKLATAFDELDRQGREEAAAAGHEIITLEGGAENAAWKPVLDAAAEKYLNELEERGLPARDVYARARELSASCGS
ncbi:C4-dicarboxylate ABC transporter substrate-binding protein [Marinobacterium nitratireducens]|uniref:C4-dicarboxylate ABC transporter substrate-binding protein n=1 Tax=Marinobacterium nitratireducens TaxID=518897 RepID=A0A917ZNH1_9GAMM|nr:TRAP transporter substrate-binding protein [Marinobacterium nitratireducens]GGO87412.1 C4-dicarboxylate ABC transporter substrate-binding protein [Marinobacterium nitratireducens]